MRDSGRDPTAPLRTRLTTGTGSPDGHRAELLQTPDETLERHRVGAADGHDDVGGREGGQRRLVASRRHGVVAQLLVVLEAEAAVDDDDLHERAGSARAPARARPRAPRATARPWAGPVSTRRPRDDLGRDARERGQVEQALVGRTAGRGDAGRLVEQPEGLRHAAAVGVGVDEQHLDATAGDLGRQRRRDRRAPGRAGGSPDRDDGRTLGAATEPRRDPRPSPLAGRAARAVVLRRRDGRSPAPAGRHVGTPAVDAARASAVAEGACASCPGADGPADGAGRPRRRGARLELVDVRRDRPRATSSTGRRPRRPGRVVVDRRAGAAGARRPRRRRGGPR